MALKKRDAGILSLIVFSVLVLVGIVIFNSISGSTANLGSTTQSRMAIGNVSANTWGAFNLVSVGPIIFGAVVILGIVGLLYLRR